MNSGCSRRALLKQRKLCHQCHRRPASLVETGSTTNEQLRFCSPTCIEQYKIQIFTSETIACLKGAENEEELSDNDVLPVDTLETNPHNSHESRSNSPQDTQKLPVSSNSQPTKSSCRGRITKRKASQQRPHPSYALNKRYWEDLRLKRSKNKSESPPRPQTQPSPKLPRVSACLPPLPPLRHMPPHHIIPVNMHPPPPIATCIHGCIAAPFPIPIPIPIPFPVPADKFAEVVVALGTHKKY